MIKIRFWTLPLIYLSKLRCILRKAHWHMFILDQVGMGSTQVFQPTIGIEHYDEELFKRTL